MPKGETEAETHRELSESTGEPQSVSVCVAWCPLLHPAPAWEGRGLGSESIVHQEWGGQCAPRGCPEHPHASSCPRTGPCWAPSPPQPWDCPSRQGRELSETFLCNPPAPPQPTEGGPTAPTQVRPGATLPAQGRRKRGPDPAPRQGRRKGDPGLGERKEKGGHSLWQGGDEACRVSLKRSGLGGW